MGDGEVMVVVSARHVGGIRCTCIVSSAADVLGMSMVRRMRGVGGVCVWGGVGVEGVRGLGLVAVVWVV